MIEIRLEGPNGPRVCVWGEVDAAEVEKAVGDEWTVDWETTPAPLDSVREGQRGFAHPLCPAPRVTLVLGRDGMGADDSDEGAFDSWTDYVIANIDEQVGFVVDVETRAPRDVQSDAIRGGSDKSREAVEEAKEALWGAWCAEGAPGAEGAS